MSEKILNFVQNRVPFVVNQSYLERLNKARRNNTEPESPIIGAGGLIAAELVLLNKNSPFDVNMFGVSMGDAEIDVLKGYHKELITHFNEKWTSDSPFIKLTEETSRTIDPKKMLKFEFKDIKYKQQLIFLDEAMQDGYYKEFANEFLWPLMHLTNKRPYEEAYKSFPKPVLNESGYRSYVATNQIFAESMLQNRLENNQRMNEGAEMIDWAHDYHLMLFPMYYRKLLHEKGLDAHLDTNDAHHLGVFWHIPFFNIDTARPLLIEDEKSNQQRKQFDPKAKSMKDVLKELTYGMLGAHAIMFHHPEYTDNFAKAVDELHPEVSVRRESETSRAWIIEHPLGTTLICSYTIGIHYDAITDSVGKGLDVKLEEGDLQSLIEQDKQAGRLVAIGLERFDYTKGVSYKLMLMETLAKSMDIRLYQATQPSRTSIPAYRNLERNCQKHINQINEQYSENEKPIIRLPKGVAPPQNLEFQRLGEAIMVTTEEDGCNVVVEEAIAAKASLPYEERGFIVLGQSGIARVFRDVSFDEKDGVTFLSMEDVEQDAEKIKKLHTSGYRISDRLITFVRDNLNTEVWSTNCLETMKDKTSRPYTGDYKPE